MKKGVSLFESIFCLILLGLVLAIFLLNFVNVRAFIICLAFIGIGLETVFFYIIAFSWRGLPKGCMYNPTGFIEIHVENMCRGNRKMFMKLCLDILLYCVIKRKNLMIDSWLIRESHIKDLFGCAAKIFTPSIPQRFMNFIFQLLYNNKFKRKCFRCIIYMDRLTPDQSKNIIEQIGKLQARLK